MKTIGFSSIKVVINGGSEVLDSATIPVRWGFSEELVEENPQYVAIVDIKGKSLSDLKSENDFKFYSNDVLFIGKTKELAAYIPMKSPGKHTFLIYVFCGETMGDASDYIDLYVKDHNPQTFFFNNLEEGGVLADGAVYVIATDFEVPDELFAHKPKKGFGRLIWSWVNKYFKKDPIDQCQYRKRKILAFSIQPFIFIFHMFGVGLLKLFTALVLAGLYMYWFLGSIILLFFGFRPLGINDFGEENSLELHDLFYFRSRYKSSRWRLWQSKDRYWWDDCENNKNNKKIPLYLIPFLYVVTGILGWTTYIFISKLGEEISSTIGNNYSMLIGVGLIFFLFYIFSLIKKARSKNKSKRDKRKKLKQREKEERAKRVNEELEKLRLTKEKKEGDKEKRFLKANASLNTLPPKVIIGDVIKKVDVSTKFRLGFMAAKSKICKPFA